MVMTNLWSFKISTNQKITNLNTKDRYPQGNTLNELQEEWKEANKSSKKEKDINQSHLETNSANLDRINRRQRR